MSDLKLTLKPTSMIVRDEDGFQGRIWEGVTQRGTPIEVIITAVRVDEELAQDELVESLLSMEALGDLPSMTLKEAGWIPPKRS